MDPDRVRSYLQVACAGLGFDIGEVWWMSDENGTGTVASITEGGGVDSNRSKAPPKKRFLQLYTSKAFCNQRSKLVQPHGDVDAEGSGDVECDNWSDRQSQEHFIHHRTNSHAASSTSSSHQLVPRGKHMQSGQDEDEHVLSPRIVEAVTKSAQVVWANCQNSQSSSGLLGRSDVKLQTAIGMPVGMDDEGHVWVVVMFSPKNVESSRDAIEYLQYIGRSAGTTGIPCLLPVVTEDRSNRLITHGGGTDSDGPGDDDDVNDQDAKRQHLNQNQSKPHHYLVSIKPTIRQSPKNYYNTHTQDILGEGVTAKFVSFNIQDDDEIDTGQSSGDGVVFHPRTPSPAVNDLRNAPKDDLGIPMLPPSAESHLYVADYGYNSGMGEDCNNPTDLFSDAFDEASYGVWSTIMNSASGRTILTSTTIASKMEAIRERLEEFLCAFLGMSVFDVGDAWILSSADVGDDERLMSPSYESTRMLTCLFTVAATDLDPGINNFREASANSSIRIGDGAVGRAFRSGYPVWSSDRSLIFDSSRYESLQRCNIETIFAVPIFSAGDVSPSCVLSCYSLLQSDSVPFVVNFVQKAVRLLWDGLDQVTNPHKSVGRDLWNNVGPSDLGEMAADLEMQKAFIGKKRPYSDISQVTGSLSREGMNSDKTPFHRSTVTEGANESPKSDATFLPSLTFNQTVAPPVRGLAPAPLFPNSTMTSNSHQMNFVNFADDGRWAVQQAVRSVGDLQIWNDRLLNQGNTGQDVTHELDYRSQYYPQQQQFSNNVSMEETHNNLNFVSNLPTNEPNRKPASISLAYVDYGHQPQSAESISSITCPPSGVHIEHPSVIQANLMDFNAMAQMYSEAAGTHIPSRLDEPSYNFNGHPPQSVSPQKIDNIRVVPLSQSEGSVILTGPQQTMFCTTQAQPIDVESRDQTTFALPNFKKCRIVGCRDEVVPRKPYCSKHCGSRQCESEGCLKHAQGATRFCIAHGGGRRCTFPGCDKGARDRYFCAAHGGGKRCNVEGCSKSAVGGSQFCTSHGGGKRCKIPGCDKSAQSSTDFCVKHGGGKKCQFEGCEKVARGKTPFCAAHGGGIRCKLEGCNRVAIGKAQLCRMHGGGANSRFTTMILPN